MQPGTIPKKPGIYSLAIFLEKDNKIKIGSLGVKPFKRGLYAYVGSGRGPGGLKTRISRHIRENKKTYWHIDYLLKNKASNVIKVYFFLTTNDLECYLVEKIASHGANFAIKTFGSSDCNCNSHLFWLSTLNILNSIKINGLKLQRREF